MAVHNIGIKRSEAFAVEVATADEALAVIVHGAEKEITEVNSAARIPAGGDRN